VFLLFVPHHIGRLVSTSSPAHCSTRSGESGNGERLSVACLIDWYVMYVESKLSLVIKRLMYVIVFACDYAQRE
jgi:hypothetical protein